MTMDPLEAVLDPAHVEAVRTACAELGFQLEPSAATALAVELDRSPNPNDAAEVMISRQFRGVRGMIALPRGREPRKLPRQVAQYLRSQRR